MMPHTHIPMATISNVPYTKDWFLGVINSRGRIYGVVDLAAYIEFGSRTWMAMPPKISQTGDVWRIENEWLLSPPSGWVEEIYEKASKQ